MPSPSLTCIYFLQWKFHMIRICQAISCYSLLPTTYVLCNMLHLRNRTHYDKCSISCAMQFWIHHYLGSKLKRKSHKEVSCRRNASIYLVVQAHIANSLKFHFFFIIALPFIILLNAFGVKGTNESMYKL